MIETIYKASPLPFQGQKRRFIVDYMSILLNIKKNKEVKLIVDLFGGSGLLSHIAKHIVPEAKVIYNDYDDFLTRLKNVDRTNKLLTDIRVILSDCPREKRINEVYKNIILSRIEEEEKSGFVDYITLSSSLLFSSNYATNLQKLKTLILYNNVKLSNYDVRVNEYVNGLDIVNMDYKKLYNKYKEVEGTIFLVDPPYLSTDTSSYKSHKYWSLKDYLDVLNILFDSKYIFFTSNKSALIDLCTWLEHNTESFNNPFSKSGLNKYNVASYSVNYTDMMLYKLD